LSFSKFDMDFFEPLKARQNLEALRFFEILTSPIFASACKNAGFLERGGVGNSKGRAIIDTLPVGSGIGSIFLKF
jgi:hypothetical protein